MALETGGSLFWRTKIDNTGLQTGAVQAKGILRTLTRSITGMDIFAGLAIGASLVFAKIIKEAYNFSLKFESAMKEVQTISKMVQGNFEGISQEIIDMSKTGPESAIRLTKALYQIISAGIDGAEAMDILRQSMELAVGGVTDTFTAADALTSIINAYGEAAGNATNISDKLFTVVRLGKTNMEELGPEITTVTGLAAQAGLAFDDLMAIIAQGTRTLKTPEMMTGIRGMLNAIITPSEDAKKLISELGIEFDTTAIRGKGFKTFLNDLITATGGNIEQLSILFPNIRGLTGLLAVASDQGEEFNKALIEVQNSTGATSEAFKIMMDTTENQMAIMKNNVIAKLKPLGDSLLGFMNNIARSINQAMSGTDDELSNLARSYSGLIDTLQRKQSIIDDLIKTIEGLRNKTELTEEETTQLHAAEKALAIYFPTLGEAAEGAAGSIDILTLAKQGSFELSKQIMGLEVERAEIEKTQAELALDRYRNNKDEANKAVKRIEDQMEIRKKMIELEVGGGRGATLTEAQKNKMIETDNEYLKLKNDLALATDTEILKSNELNLILKEKITMLDAQKEAYKRLIESQGKPIAIPTTTTEEPPKTITIPAINIEEVEDKLKYMASQYKRYLDDIAKFGEEYVEENNIQLAEEGKNYSQYLSEMLTKYKDNAELTKIITNNIYEYNKTVIEKKKKIEDELFGYITGARDKDLKAEKDRFEAIIKNYEEGSTEYLEAIEQHNKNILEINEKYNKEIAEAALAIFKENLGKQIDELDNNYKLRLEIARAELGEETEANKEYFEFVNDKLQEIAEIEKEKANKDKETLQSYFESYQTIEEKIISIHEKTNELLLLTDVKYERDRLKIIEEQLIAEVKFSKAKQEIDDKLAEYGEDLNNKELEDKIKTLEEMKVKYSEYADIIILLDKDIAESQKQIWENINNEINKTVDTLHALADVVGNFDTELEEAINDMADLIGGIGEITIGFSTGNIAGIISGIAAAINSIINLFVKTYSDVPELREELQAITLELQKQQTILSQSSGTAKTEAIQDTIDLLEDQIDTYNKMIEAEKEAYGQFLWWTWSEVDQEKIEEWLSAIESANAEIANLYQQYQEILTGTTTESIADAIAEGFSQGLDSAQVFADTFNDMMRKAILDAFKRTIITKYIEDWYDQFAILAEGGLTPEEIEDLTGTYQEMIEAAETQWEAIQGVLESAGMELEEAGRKGLTGAIAGITEETAGLLAGQFQAIRINTVDILSNMESIIIINSRIADNTEYNKYLKDINDKLSKGISLESEYLRAIGGA
jgi:TP901 family phage tail tape measure protein